MSDTMKAYRAVMLHEDGSTFYKSPLYRTAREAEAFGKQFVEDATGMIEASGSDEDPPVFEVREEQTDSFCSACNDIYDMYSGCSCGTDADLSADWPLVVF